MSERNVYIEPEERAVIRTADVYQTESEIGTTGYSDTLLSVVATSDNSGAPEGFNARCMVGKSKRGEVAMRLFAIVDPVERRFVRVGFKSRGCLAMTACSSTVCAMLEGKTFDEALAITGDDIKTALDGVPWDRLIPCTSPSRAPCLDRRFSYSPRSGHRELDRVAPCDHLQRRLHHDRALLASRRTHRASVRQGSGVERYGR